MIRNFISFKYVKLNLIYKRFGVFHQFWWFIDFLLKRYMYMIYNRDK